MTENYYKVDLHVHTPPHRVTTEKKQMKATGTY